MIPGRSQFRHHRGNPLHLDLLVVDEASMVDLPMMARLLDALPRHARLILLGDKDQLASVEAGPCSGISAALSNRASAPRRRIGSPARPAIACKARQRGQCARQPLFALQELAL